MKNFRLIGAGIDTVPALLEIQTQPELWNLYKFRGEDSYHSAADDIICRYNRWEKSWNKAQLLERVGANVDCVNYPAFDMLPEVQKLVFGLMARVKGEHLGRVVISRLAPGKEIPRHSDRISLAEEMFPEANHPAIYFERFHVVLQGLPGSTFFCGTEQVQMESGQVWWIDNTDEHGVVNSSADDRIHLVVDIRPWKPAAYAPTES